MMPNMGRPKTVFPDLPPRMTARKLKSGKVLFYYTGNGGKQPLGSDYGKALHQYADLETGDASGLSFRVISEKWETDGIRAGKRGKIRAPKTQAEFKRALTPLRKAFGHILLDQIAPKLIRQYLDGRSKKIAANREIAVFSVVWNWARQKGLTDKANPTLGIDRNAESSRDIYVTEGAYKAVWDKAVPLLQDAMDLALLTSQRPSDVLKMTRQDIRDGELWLRQGKTGHRMRVSIEGELKTVVERILARPRAVSSVFLIADDKGQRVTIWKLDKLFAEARGEATWQFRDLRAKAVTDEPDLRAASQRAGHADETITAKVYRRLKGNSVKPLR
jgi:integrase